MPTPDSGGARWVREDWHGGSGPPAVFVHANGFPPLAYTPFLESLARRLEVAALATRPLTDARPPDLSLRWRDMGSDIALHLRDTGAPPVIAVGHSMGATSLIDAVASHPERFAALVLIEPAMLGPLYAAIFRVAPDWFRRRVGPARATWKKRDWWPDEAAFRATCERSGLYRRFAPAAMDCFVEHALVPAADGVTLRFPKAWEAWSYMTPPDPVPTLRRVGVPVVGLRGEPSIFLDDARWKRVVAAQPEGWLRQLDGVGHLAPLEDPAKTADAVLEGLGALGLV